MAGEAAVITLDDIAAGVDLACLSQPEAAALLHRVAAVQARLASRIIDVVVAQPEDRLLDVEEAAQTLKVDRQWLYRRTNKLPFVVRLEGQVRYSATGIQRFIASRRGA